MANHTGGESSMNSVTSAQLPFCHMWHTEAIWTNFKIGLILCRTYGVVGNITAALHKQGPHGAFTPALSLLLRYSTTGSPGNQNAALSKGAIPAVNAVLQSNHTGWRQREAVRLLTELTRGNDAVKQAALKEGETLTVQHGPDVKHHKKIRVLLGSREASRKVLLLFCLRPVIVATGSLADI